MRIALVSDTWTPQVNGVVRTLTTTVDQLRAMGHVVCEVTPEHFRTVPCPSYPEIRLALGSGRAIRQRIERFRPNAVHIATEGPIGWAARRWCLDTGSPFTTSFHTRFPEYVSLRTGLSPNLLWPVIRRFHAAATRIMVATPTLAAELAAQGLPHTHLWSRGVDLDLFNPHARPSPLIAGMPGPIQLYVGRVAIEKNITAFLDTKVPGTKVVVGDGPARLALQHRYPDVRFLGALHGDALASAYAAADVFVFASRTDTFGLVMIEALAAGVPVAALPVPGPLDILGSDGRGAGGTQIGVLDRDLNVAIRVALTLDRAHCATEARRYSWMACTSQFLAGILPNDAERPRVMPPASVMYQATYNERRERAGFAL